MAAKQRPKPILDYAGPKIDRTIYFGERTIHIFNEESRFTKCFSWAIGGILLILPLVRPYLPGRLWLSFDEPGAAGWFGLLLYGFVILACICGGFRWSTVVIDLGPRRVNLHRRWGPFYHFESAAIESFKTVEINTDSDGDSTVRIIGKESWLITRGHSRTKSIGIAEELSRRVGWVLKKDSD